jgi:hypothetical protein
MSKMTPALRLRIYELSKLLSAAEEARASFHKSGMWDDVDRVQLTIDDLREQVKAAHDEAYPQGV